MNRNWQISIAIALAWHGAVAVALPWLTPRAAAPVSRSDGAVTIEIVAETLATSSSSPATVPKEPALPHAQPTEAPPAPDAPPPPTEIVSRAATSIAPAPEMTHVRALEISPPAPSAETARPVPASTNHVSTTAIASVRGSPERDAAVARVADGRALEIEAHEVSVSDQREVGARPKYLKKPEPAYPSSARRRRQEGLVILSVTVTAEGKAARLTVEKSSGYPALDEAALSSVSAWEFEPARLGNRAMASAIEVPIRFRLPP